MIPSHRLLRSLVLCCLLASALLTPRVAGYAAPSIVSPVSTLSPDEQARLDAELFSAAQNDEVEEARALLARGANPNSQSIAGYEGNTALMTAASSHAGGILRLLLQNGANPNLRNGQGETALMMAYELSHVLPLVQGGADLNARDNQGQTVLMHAISYRDGRDVIDIARVRLFLKLGADPNMADTKGQTSIDRAARYVNRQVLNLLLAHPGVAEPQKVKLRRALATLPLLRAARLGDVRSVRHALSQNVDVNVIDATSSDPLDINDTRGVTLLGMAVRGGSNLIDSPIKGASKDSSAYLEIARLLLAHGANPESVVTQDKGELRGDPRGETVLVGAVARGNKRMAALLLDSGARVNRIDFDGNTALGKAVLLENSSVANGLELTRLLLRRGADPNVAGPNGARTPLLVATSSPGPNTVAIVEMLLARGAGIESRSEEGTTPLIAVASSLGLLEGPPGSPPHSAPVLKALLRAGARADARDNQMRTPLMMAVRGGSLPVVEMLLGHGASLKARDKKGWTPLMHAVAAGYAVHRFGPQVMPFPPVVRALLARRADVNARNWEGATPLMLAARIDYRSVGYKQPSSDDMSRLTQVTDVVQLLVAGGAKVNLRDKNGNSALDWAQAQGYGRMARLLRRAGASGKKG